MPACPPTCCSPRSRRRPPWPSAAQGLRAASQRPARVDPHRGQSQDPGSRPRRIRRADPGRTAQGIRDLLHIRHKLATVLEDGHNAAHDGKSETAMTAGRRGRGEGSIQRCQDDVWVGTVDLGVQGGRRTRKSVYGKTQRDVREKLRALQRVVEAGATPAPANLTVGRFFEIWLLEFLPGTVNPGPRTSTATS